MISTAEAKALMRRCRSGCGGDDPLDAALDILAACHSMIGKLVQERDALRRNDGEHEEGAHDL